MALAGIEMHGIESVAKFVAAGEKIDTEPYDNRCLVNGELIEKSDCETCNRIKGAL